MHYKLYDVKESGVMAVFYNEFQTKCDEYNVVSLFRHGGILHFGQFVGYDGLRQYTGNAYDVDRARLDGKNNLYTIKCRDSFRYKLPFAYKEPKAIVMPSEQMCRDLLKRLVGIDDWALIGKYFSAVFVKDELPTSRKMLIVHQKYYSNEAMKTQNEADLLNEFQSLERTPFYFKGGELGDIE